MNGDAQNLKGIDDESLDFVYSSHCLEHMVDVRIALLNWFRVVRKGGYLILYIPHRDLYEKQDKLPSRFNKIANECKDDFEKRRYFRAAAIFYVISLDLWLSTCQSRT